MGLAPLPPGTAIVVDNVVREGEVMDAASSDPDVIGMRRMFELMARVAAQQTVAPKAGMASRSPFVN